MLENENAPDAGKHEANLETNYSSDFNQDKANSQGVTVPLLCSGYGQFHTNELGKEKRKPYNQIDLAGIRNLVDNPQEVNKSQAQWLIPSALLSRTFKEQEAHGEFWMLWADIDQATVPLIEIAEIIESLIQGCDYEIYTSKSATQNNQKCRILIPLSKPMSFSAWFTCQEILNDKLESHGIIPDRASERPAQLCYLPNRGEFYNFKSKRNNKNFDPLIVLADEINTRREEIAKQAKELEVLANEAKSKRAASKFYSGGNKPSPSLIDVFNDAYTVQEFLLGAGYKQQGNKFRHPNSESDSFSASVQNGRVHSLSSSDPLFTGGNGGGAHDAFSAFTVLNHNGDEKAALKDAGDNWVLINGDAWNKVNHREYMREKDAVTYLDIKNWEDEPAENEKTDEEKSDSQNFEDVKSFILEYPPGIAGEIAEYIFGSSRMPVKSFAIASALTTVSHFNKNYSYVKKSNTSLNLYQCLMGGTGKGKEDPRKAIKRLVDAASNNFEGEESQIHESMASGAALLRSLEEHPNSLILIDELGISLQNALSDKGLVHQKDFMKELMVLYGSGRSFYAGKVYADKKQNIDRIDKPYINLLGTTTPLELLDGITPNMIDNGFLNRIIFVQVDNENPINREPDIHINEELVKKLKSHKGIGTDTRIQEIDYEDGAHDLLIQYVESLNEKDQFANLWGRAEEQTIRVAGLLAIGDGGIIKRDHVTWAWNYVNGSIKTFAQKLDKDLSENQFQKQTAKALEFIRNAKNYTNDCQFGKFCRKGLMPRGKLTKLLKMKSKEVDEVITYLSETRQISHCDSGGVKCFSFL